MRLITDRRRRAKGKRMLEREKRSALTRRLIMIVQTARTTFLYTRARETKRSRYPSFKREFVMRKIAANTSSLHIEGIVPRPRFKFSLS